MIEQEEFELKHIALLRKVIMEKRSGVASFEGRDWAAVITFDRGVLLDENLAEDLANILQGPVFRFNWVDSIGRQEGGVVAPTLPRQAFSQAIAILDLRENRLAAYREMFSKLPAVTVRFTTSFRFDLEYQKLFQQLYQMAMAAEGAKLKDYFSAASGGVELRKRMNVVIAIYCLGDLLPAIKRAKAAAPSAASVTRPTETNNVVSRIMARLRGA